MTEVPVKAHTHKLDWARLAAILACAFATGWIYTLFIRLVARTTSAEPTYVSEALRWIRPLTRESLDGIGRHTHGLWYTTDLMACCAGLFLLYAIVLWLARGFVSRWLMLLSVGASVVFMGILVCSPVMLSNDVYAYAHYGRLLAVDHVDAHGPDAVAEAGANKSDPFSLDGYYDFVASVYGPFWTVLSAGLVLAGHDHVGLTVLLFRALEVASALGCGGLIWLVLNQLAPQRAALGTLLFLWNPLVVIESAMSGHNDTCMMFLALLAVWLHLRGWKIGAVVALALSALVKVITWPLVPLYILMLLRNSPGWKERALLVVRAALGIAVTVILSMLVARMNPNGLTAHTASSAQFYENNYHELLFKGLRRLLGEPADSIEAPMDFKTWWAQTCGPTILHQGTNNKSKDLARLKPDQPLLVISDEDSDDWLRVYDPAHHLQGYVDWPHLIVIQEPRDAENDPTIRRLSGWPPEWPTVIRANWWIRFVTWSAFVAFGLIAAWKTKDFDTYLLWAASFFVASQLLVFTKIWPWYVIWPLAFGALKPTKPITWLAVMLSAGMTITYALFDYCNTPSDWLYEYRSLFTIVLPVLLFILLKLIISARPARAALS
jgi:hypothetical protein